MKLGHKKIALGDSPGLIGRLHESSNYTFNYIPKIGSLQ